MKKQRERCRKNRKRTQNYNTYKRGHRQSLRERVNEIKESVPCADCKNFFPACVLDFDHLPGCKKIDTISRMVTRQVAWVKIEREMKKCEIVCRVCHGIRTHIGRDFLVIPNKIKPKIKQR